MDMFNINDDKDLPEYFVTAMTLDYESRINMQAIWQSHIDSSISSTVNLPESATVEDIENLYLYAWNMGLKGVTLFRDKCKRAGVLSTDVSNEESKNELKRGEIIEVCDNVIGLKRKLMTGCGTLHCEAFFDPVTGDLLETYLSKGSTGGCNNFMVGLSRMISISARGGVPLDKIVDQLNSTGVCPSYAVRRATMHDTSKGSCCPMAVGNALLDMHKQVKSFLQTELSEHDNIENSDASLNKYVEDNNTVCPECGEPLIFEGGCNICKNCGWSRCS